MKYGEEPYTLEMHLLFPPSFPDLAEQGEAGTVLVQMAPLKDMPYSVLTFLDMVRAFLDLPRRGPAERGHL